MAKHLHKRDVRATVNEMVVDTYWFQEMSGHVTKISPLVMHMLHLLNLNSTTEHQTALIVPSNCCTQTSQPSQFNYLLSGGHPLL